MGNKIGILIGGVIITVLAIIALVSIVLPQMHTGYLYLNNTIGTAEMPGGPSLWGVIELIFTIAFAGMGLAATGWELFSMAKGSRHRR